MTRSNETGPFNIGSEELISINDFAFLIAEIAKKEVKIKHIDGPTGVRGRCSDNTIIAKAIGWEPKIDLKTGVSKLYAWIENELKNTN